MNRDRRKYPVIAAALAAGIAAASLPARAEILFLDGGKVVSADAGYAYQHPSLRSVVFVTPEARQMAILPPAPVFIAPPPLLWRAPTAMPVYPPPMPYVGGINYSSRPSNRDLNTYNMQRAHAFSQELFYRDTYLSLGHSNPALIWYSYGGLGPAYPPPQPAGFNQPARPSNRDNAAYHMERAHRFSMDLYKKP